MNSELIAHALLWIFTLLLIFHAAILFKLIPYSIVWGGRLKSDKAMYQFEAVSIVMNGLLICFALEEAYNSFAVLNEADLNIVWWGCTGLFTLNTLGNIKSTNRFEKLVFTPVTLILTACCLLLATN